MGSSTKGNRWPGALGVRFIIISCALALVCCSDPLAQKPPPDNPPSPGSLSAWLFPFGSVGQSAFWTFSQSVGPTFKTGVDGVQQWTLASVEARGDTVISTVMRVFSGEVSALFHLNMYLAADTSSFVIREYGGTVTVDVSGQGQRVTYWGGAFSFSRSLLENNPTEIQLPTDQVWPVYLKLGAGIMAINFYQVRSAPNYAFLTRVEGIAIPSMESADYFPPFSVGDTISWDFHQRIPVSTTDVTLWDGIVRWTLVSTQLDGPKRLSQVERVFTGRRLHVVDGSEDTARIAGDISTFACSDSAGIIQVSLGGGGNEITYPHWDMQCDRFVPTRYGESIEIYPQNLNSSAVLKRGVGLTSISTNRESSSGYNSQIPSWSYVRR